ncbi:MAG: carboxypeptidase regulatory-like domain-containing protein [Chitinophagaceae bacterium]|nr:carboxypeptidase regulatory-like domain-containing protein [Chitinophagaceae bacterium]
MNDQSQHITHYTAADIQRYLSGNMTASEMHAMEKAALDDPFLADALEGMDEAMQSHGEASVNDNLADLRTAIAEKINPGSGKVRVMVWWKMAAAAVVVIVAGIFAWNGLFRSDRENSTPVVAQKRVLPAPPPAATDSSPAPATAAIADSVSVGQADEQASRLTLHRSQGATYEKFPSTYKTPDAQKNADASYDNTARSLAKTMPQQKRAQGASLLENFNKPNNRPAAATIPLDTNIPAKVMDERAEVVTLQRNDNRLQFNFSDTVGRPVRTEIVGALQGHVPGVQAVSMSEKDRKKLSNVIRGRVVDNAERPIANAYLRPQESLENMGTTYLTDREGYFNIPAKLQDSGALNVSVAAVGFNTQQFKLNPNIVSNQVQLQPSNLALNEVVVAGYGKKGGSVSKRYKEADILQQNAEPVYGWVGYEKYLSENNRLTRSDSSTVKGDVSVSFVVTRNGGLSEFTITSGLTQQANQEAIRLIKEGPSWKIKRGRKATATVIVHF